MSVLQTLESLVNAYKSRLYDDLEAKNEKLALPDYFFAFDRAELLDALRELWEMQRTIVGRFALAKYGLELCLGPYSLKGANDLIASWLFACLEDGAYEDCIRFSDLCFESKLLDRIDDQFKVLRSRAKSLRNLGRLQEAQDCYRQILSLAHEVGDSSGISMGLLLIVKLYGTYWGQLTLFSSFVEEAKTRLEHELSASTISRDETARLKRRLAICHDALGQAYRDSEPDRVEKHFLEAVRLNQELGRTSGISRSFWHLNYLKFKRCAPEEQSVYLQLFDEEIRKLHKNADEHG
jgi:tetratricopeptide (TPR) repeat protein